GEIIVRSEPDKGSLFRLRIPFALLNKQHVAGLDLPRHEHLNAKLGRVDGLSCLVLVGQDGIAGDCAAYLASAGAVIERVSDLASLQQSLVSRPPGLTIVVIDSTDVLLPIDELRAAVHTPAGAQTRFVARLVARLVVIGRGLGQSPRQEDADLVLLDGNVLTRRTLLKAVAIAAGRAQKPDQESLHNETKAILIPLSHTEARRQGRLILIAEDNEINQKVILQQLTLLGQTAVIAHNGREALGLWQRGNFGILITDLHMPGMDGYELTTAIRADESGKIDKTRIPIIAFPANVLKGEVERCLRRRIDPGPRSHSPR
ncbi:response regulator, partial [bacterium]|nr:response regulator [bacterium]